MSEGSLTRREFLARAAAASAGAVAGTGAISVAERAAGAAAAAATTEPGRKPNILLIISDEHSQRFMGCAGDKIIQTATMGGLARRGVMFENCYTSCPICVPARLSLTSGRYCSRVSAWSNLSMLPPETPSLPRIMNAAGYESFLAGKMHYDSSTSYGFQEIGRKWHAGAFMPGTGDRRKADDLAPNPTPYPDWKFTDKPDKDGDIHFGVAGTAPVLRQAWRVTAAAKEFFAKRSAADKPFFLLLGYEAPHYPLVVPKAYYEAYKGRVPMPVIPAGFLDKMPLNYKHLRAVQAGATISDETIRYARELYYGLTQFVDEEIGKCLAALTASGQADNTIVIYTSDHGENLGEHGLWWKGCMYEQATNIPLIVSYPSRWKGGQRRTGACSMLDMVRTIAEMGGAQTPDNWNGTSLVQWLDKPETKWKDQAVVEYYAQHVTSGYSMIRMGQWKYVYHTAPDASHGVERELYDLESDPMEFSNLAAEAKHKDRIARMHAAMVQEIGQEPDEIEARARQELRRGYGRAKPSA